MVTGEEAHAPPCPSASCCHPIRCAVCLIVSVVHLPLDDVRCSQVIQCYCGARHWQQDVRCHKPCAGLTVEHELYRPLNKRASESTWPALPWPQQGTWSSDHKISVSSTMSHAHPPQWQSWEMTQWPVAASNFIVCSVLSLLSPLPPLPTLHCRSKHLFRVNGKKCTYCIMPVIHL